MATQAQIDSFVSEYASYAQQAAAATGLNAQLILAQWGNETNYGTQWAEKNNIGNVGVYGGGPNPSYGTIQQGVQAYINEINSPAMASVKATAGQSIEAQAAALGASGYAGGGYNDGSGPGSSLLQDANVIASGGYGSDVAVTPGTESATTEYLQSLNAQNQANAAVTDTTDVIGGQTFTGTGQQTTALATIEGDLANYGFTPTQVQSLTNFAWQEITNNVDPTQIAIDIQGQPAFKEAFPYFQEVNTALVAQGQAALNPATYQSLTQGYLQSAQAAGLPPGMLTPQDIATLMTGNVSASELSSRINDAIAYTQATPDAQAAFNQYFGTSYGDSGQGALSLGQMAAIVLDPSKAEPLIHQQIAIAQIGGAATLSGVGSISQQTATELAQAGISTAQATSAFQGLAPYAALAAARPGMGGEAAQGTVTADQLATGELLGNPAAQRQLQQAVEVAKAPFSGGGGFVTSSKGTVGAGSASSSGAGQT